MRSRRDLRGLLTTALLGTSLACAATPAPPPAGAAAPAVRCRTVLDVRPGPYGSASRATPVQRCEPVLPPAAAE